MVAALVTAGAVTRADGQRARALLAHGEGPPVAVLVGAGFDARAVASAASKAYGTPLLPDKWLERPKPPTRLPAELSVFARLGAAPVGTLKGQLCVVYADPEVATAEGARMLPSHKAYLATNDDVRRILALAERSGASFVAVEEPPRLPSGAISALPLGPDEVDTVYEQPRLSPDFDGVAPTSAEDDEAPTVRVEPTKTEPADPNATVALGPASVPVPRRESAVRLSSDKKTSLDDARERALSALPRFHVRGVLGRGGMATVYLADDKERRAQVALKLMEPHLAEDPTFVERFRREVRATSSFDHENVVRPYDGGLEGDTLYLAAEYVDGGTLRDLLVGTGPMPAALVAPILYQALRGLAHAHDRGIVHRDLKPANILLTTTGIVKVGDFGVAKSQSDNTLTQSGMLFGTPAYMSPEQAFGKNLDGRSDLFSLSTLLYELLTGRNPYHHENMSTSLLMVSKAGARPIFEVCPTLPPLLDDVLSRMMERDRGQRFPDAHAAADKLEPLVTAIEERFGNVLEQALRAPRETAAKLARAQAGEELRRAQMLLAGNEPRPREAAFCLYKAQRLDRENPVSASFLRQLIDENGFTFGGEDDPQIADLEAALGKKPDSPALLRRGADLMLARRDLLGAAVWIRRYTRAQPGDLHMEHALESIVGKDPLAPFPSSASKSPPPPDPAAAPAEQPSFALPTFSPSPPGAAPVYEDTAYVRSVSKGGPLAALKANPAASFAVAAASLFVVISVPLVFLGADKEAPRLSANAPRPTPSAGEELLRLTTDPDRLKARLAIQRAKIEESRRLADRGQLADATAALDAAIAEDPGSEAAVDALLERARLYVNLRRLDDARDDLDKVTKLVEDGDPRAANARKLLSEL